MIEATAKPGRQGCKSGSASFPSWPGPWVDWLLAVSVTSIFVGLIWDISWHMTIGRDTFWTPAHMAIYLGGAIPGFTCGLIAIRTTFSGSPEEKASSVNIWGGRAPFGAWIVIWGALAMLTAGPFDDWWHSAYGLDVKIISPPHILLFVGMFAVVGGTLLYLLRNTNRAGAGGERGSGHLFLYVAGCLTGLVTYLFFAEGWPNRQHGATFYYVSAWIYPGVLIAVARASRRRWAASLCALSYMGILVAMVWILPRFPAQPKLGPVLMPIDHMVPPYFPHLLVLPALALDWLHSRFGQAGGGRRWLLSSVSALVFVALFIFVQWNFSRFLLSPAARNPFFAGDQSWPYYSGVGDRRYAFFEPLDLFTAASLVRIGVASVLSAAIGTLAGLGLRKVIR